MADRNQKDDQSTAKSAPKSGKGDGASAGRDDGLERNADPETDKSTASRPRGHTEEPDRTL
jgi:hypothetical protein